MQNQAKQEAVRLLKWIRENRTDWNMICGVGDVTDISDDDMYRLLNTMMDNSFYQIALVLLASYAVHPKSERAVFYTFIDTLIKQENGDGIERYFQEMIANFH